MKKLFTLFLLVIFISVNGCIPIQESSETQEIQVIYRVHQDKIRGFSIEYPQGWKVIEDNVWEDMVTFEGPKEEIYILSRYEETEKDLDGYVEEQRELFTNPMFGGAYKLIDEGEMTIGNQEAHYLEYNFMRSKIKRVFLEEKDGKIFFVSVSAPVNEFEEYKQVFDYSISTYRLLE